MKAIKCPKCKRKFYSASTKGSLTCIYCEYKLTEEDKKKAISNPSN